MGAVSSAPGVQSECPLYNLSGCLLRACSRLRTPAHACARLLTPSHAFSRLLAPSRAFSRLLTPSHAFSRLLTPSFSQVSPIPLPSVTPTSGSPSPDLASRPSASSRPLQVSKKQLMEAREAQEAINAEAAAAAAQATVEFWAAAAARLPKSAQVEMFIRPCYLPWYALPSDRPWCALAATWQYRMEDVTSTRDLGGSVLVRPADRVEWFLALGELMALTDEATRRHGVALKLHPLPTYVPSPYHPVAHKLHPLPTYSLGGL